MKTIRDIARIAGVSVATVSKVINNYPDISERTKQKVLEVMKRGLRTECDRQKPLRQAVILNRVLLLLQSCAWAAPLVFQTCCTDWNRRWAPMAMIS